MGYELVQGAIDILSHDQGIQHPMSLDLKGWLLQIDLIRSIYHRRQTLIGGNPDYPIL